jgi:hypothetical protein
VGIFSRQLLEQIIESDAVDKHGFVDSVDVVWVDALRQERVSVDAHFFEGCILNRFVKMFFMTIFH